MWIATHLNQSERSHEIANDPEPSPPAAEAAASPVKERARYPEKRLARSIVAPRQFFVRDTAFELGA
jgi:hypothetical protein